MTITLTDCLKDDGSHSIACDTCNVWQHSSCHGIGREEAEREDFHFVCAACKQHLANSSREHIPSIKIRLKPAQAFQTSHSIDEQPRLSPIRVESELHRLENVKEKVDLSKVAKLDSPAILQSVVVSSMTSEACELTVSLRT